MWTQRENTGECIFLLRMLPGYDMVKDDNDFYQSAVAFGHFQRLLADYPAETLHETIVNFHNTVDRFAKFKAAVEADSEGRATSVQEEIKFVLDREELAHTLCDLQDTGKNASSCNSQ